MSTIPRGTTPKPDWREVILDAIDAKDTRDRHSFAVNLPPAWSKIVNGGAEARGMSVTAYVRRAVLAFACVDLGIDWLELAQSEPLIGAYGVRGGRSEKVDAEGYGFGPWKIVTLEEYRRESGG